MLYCAQRSIQLLSSIHRPSLNNSTHTMQGIVEQVIPDPVYAENMQKGSPNNNTQVGKIHIQSSLSHCVCTSTAVYHPFLEASILLTPMLYRVLFLLPERPSYKPILLCLCNVSSLVEKPQVLRSLFLHILFPWLKYNSLYWLTLLSLSCSTLVSILCTL